MNRKWQINYLMSHPGYMPYLIVSLYSLRQHWSGRVAVFAWGQSFEMVKQISHDWRLDIQAIERQPAYTGKNDQFLDKIELCQSFQPWHLVNAVAYLDADTIVTGSFEPILNMAETCGFVATQFCDWKTNKGIIAKRITRLKEFPEIDQSLVEEVLKNEYPSPNGGCFACRPESPVLPTWYDWTMKAKRIFIADEMILQLMPLMYPSTHVVRDGLFNCSTIRKYIPKSIRPEWVHVWHGHGNSFSRLDKAPDGHDWWKRLFVECMKDNIGNCRKWAPDCFGDRTNHKFFKLMEMPT